jgi:hypothetical protein
VAYNCLISTTVRTNLHNTVHLSACMQYITMLVFTILVHFNQLCTSGSLYAMKCKLYKTSYDLMVMFSLKIFSISLSFMSYTKIWAKICSDQEISFKLLNRFKKNLEHTFLTLQWWCLACDNLAGFTFVLEFFSFNLHLWGIPQFRPKFAVTKKFLLS